MAGWNSFNGNRRISTSSGYDETDDFTSYGGNRFGNGISTSDDDEARQPHTNNIDVQRIWSPFESPRPSYAGILPDNPSYSRVFNSGSDTTDSSMSLLSESFRNMTALSLTSVTSERLRGRNNMSNGQQSETFMPSPSVATNRNALSIQQNGFSTTADFNISVRARTTSDNSSRTARNLFNPNPTSNASTSYDYNLSNQNMMSSLNHTANASSWENEQSTNFNDRVSNSYWRETMYGPNQSNQIQPGPSSTPQGNFLQHNSFRNRPSANGIVNGQNNFDQPCTNISLYNSPNNINRNSSLELKFKLDGPLTTKLAVKNWPTRLYIIPIGTLNRDHDVKVSVSPAELNRTVPYDMERNHYEFKYVFGECGTYTITVIAGGLVIENPFTVNVVELRTNPIPYQTFPAPRKIWGLSYDRQENSLFICSREDNAVYRSAIGRDGDGFDQDNLARRLSLLRPSKAIPVTLESGGMLIYVTDKDNGRVIALDPNTGDEIYSSCRTQSYPWSLCASPDNKYILVTCNDGIQVFHQDLVKKKFITLKHPASEDCTPRGICVGFLDHVLIADFNNTELLYARWDSKTVDMLTIFHSTSLLMQPEQRNAMRLNNKQPSTDRLQGMCIDKLGNILITDSRRKAVKVIPYLENQRHTIPLQLRLQDVITTDECIYVSAIDEPAGYNSFIYKVPYYVSCPSPST